MDENSALDPETSSSTSCSSLSSDSVEDFQRPVSRGVATPVVQETRDSSLSTTSCRQEVTPISCVSLADIRNEATNSSADLSGNQQQTTASVEPTSSLGGPQTSSSALSEVQQPGTSFDPDPNARIFQSGMMKTPKKSRFRDPPYATFTNKPSQERGAGSTTLEVQQHIPVAATRQVRTTRPYVFIPNPLSQRSNRGLDPHPRSPRPHRENSPYTGLARHNFHRAPPPYFHPQPPPYSYYLPPSFQGLTSNSQLPQHYHQREFPAHARHPQGRPPSYPTQGIYSFPVPPQYEQNPENVPEERQKICRNPAHSHYKQ